MGKDTIILLLEIGAEILNLVVNRGEVLLDEFLQCIGLQAGAVVVGCMEGDTANSFHFPSPLFINLFMGIGISRTTARLSRR